MNSKTLKLLALATGLGTLTACPAGSGTTTDTVNKSMELPGVGAVTFIDLVNGTGLAGLRAHLKARALAGATRNWLLFGERQRAHDAFLADELAAWQAQGLLPHLDLTFSRDGDAHRYVQHALASHANRLRQWVDEGAAVYVCGSLAGMAPDVDATLRRILGEDKVEALRIAGRYRRDVY